VIDLKISAEDYKASYLEPYQVLALSRDGQRLRFPANILRPYVTHHGIDGTFLIHTDDRHRFLAIEPFQDN
jgi:hypothetical protein